MTNTNQQGELLSLFSTPVVITNIGRDFTKDEVECFQNIPMRKDEKIQMCNHQSRDSYLFDTFAEELEDIKKFCEYHLKNY